MSQPVRRRLEQPSEERAKRSGCLMWGAVLGVLVGIMVGIYALPPILKHYYGEHEVAFAESWSEGGRTIQIAEPGRPIEPVDAAPGSTQHFFMSVVISSEEEWRSPLDHWSLELDGIEDWQIAACWAGPNQRVAAGTVPCPREDIITIPAGIPTEVVLHFIIQLGEDFEGRFLPEALHLSDPRVKFELQ